MFYTSSPRCLSAIKIVSVSVLKEISERECYIDKRVHQNIGMTCFWSSQACFYIIGQRYQDQSKFINLYPKKKIKKDRLYNLVIMGWEYLALSINKNSTIIFFSAYYVQGMNLGCFRDFVTQFFSNSKRWEPLCSLFYK